MEYAKLVLSKDTNYNIASPSTYL